MKKYIPFLLLLIGCSRQPVMEPEVPQASKPTSTLANEQENSEAPSPCWEEVKEKSFDAWELTKEKAEALKEYLRHELHEATAPEE